MAAPGYGAQPQPQYGAPPPPQPAYGGYGGAPAFPQADVAKRIIAWLIDAVILWVLSMIFGIVGAIVGGASYSYTSMYSFSGISLIFNLIFWVLAFLYWPFQHATQGGQTVGQKLMKVKVVLESGQPLEWGTAIKRDLILSLSSAFCGLGYLVDLIVYLTDPEKRSLCDKIGGSRVVPEEYGAAAGYGAAPAAPAGYGQPPAGPPPGYGQPPAGPPAGYGQPPAAPPAAPPPPPMAPPPPQALPPQAPPPQAPPPQAPPPPGYGPPQQ